MNDQTKGTKKLIFVYNADSGVFNLLSDVAKKAFNIEGTCSLCDLTHDPLSVKDEWKKFVESLSYPTVFLHRDEFQKEYPHTPVTTFPVVLLEEGNDVNILLTATDINNVHDLEKLKRLIQDTISE